MNVRINPGLVAALEHYAGTPYSFKEPTVFVHNDSGGGWKHHWSLERTCGLAFEILSSEELNLLKLKALQNGLKKAGMERLYEHIMGEKLPE